jgi:tetratricopeptide (TPR) repeat protein
MKLSSIGSMCLALTLAACGSPNGARTFEGRRATTNSAIAIANLDHLIDQSAGEPGVDELLLLRSRMLADYDALDRVTGLTEDRSGSADELLRRARSRSAVHRFDEALADIDAAVLAGAKGAKVDAQQASILLAMGRAKEVVGQLESDVRRRPAFATHAALAGAYASLGRLAEADQLYAVALGELDTTSPFPYAWIYFMRGLMWSEQGNDRQRGEAMYAQAVRHVPEFAAANIHLAELEVARNDWNPAMDRLDRIAAAFHEPEALALLGRLHIRIGQGERGRQEVASARMRYEALLAKHPLAFADHAAEFHLAMGDDVEQAWHLAQRNLAVRQTRRAHLLAIRAAQATHRDMEARELAIRMRERFGPRAA